MIDNIDKVIFGILGIYGIILLIGGILISNGEYNCEIENKLHNSADVCIFIGTILSTLFIAFLSFMLLLKTKKLPESSKVLLFRHPAIIMLCITAVASIVSISLGAVSKNGIKDEQDKENSCYSAEAGSALILWSGIIYLLLILTLALIKFMNKKKKKGSGNKSNSNSKSKSKF